MAASISARFLSCTFLMTGTRIPPSVETTIPMWIAVSSTWPCGRRRELRTGTSPRAAATCWTMNEVRDGGFSVPFDTAAARSARRAVMSISRHRAACGAWMLSVVVRAIAMRSGERPAGQHGAIGAAGQTGAAASALRTSLPAPGRGARSGEGLPVDARLCGEVPGGRRASRPGLRPARGAATGDPADGSPAHRAGEAAALPAAAGAAALVSASMRACTDSSGSRRRGSRQAGRPRERRLPRRPGPCQHAGGGGLDLH